MWGICVRAWRVDFHRGLSLHSSQCFWTDPKCPSAWSLGRMDKNPSLISPMGAASYAFSELSFGSITCTSFERTFPHIRCFCSRFCRVLFVFPDVMVTYSCNSKSGDPGMLFPSDNPGAQRSRSCCCLSLDPWRYVCSPCRVLRAALSPVPLVTAVSSPSGNF